MRIRYPLLLLTGLMLALGCSSDPAGPSELPEDQLTFLRLATGAPPFVSSEVTFWARRGEDREGRIYFQDSQGGRGEEFARLKVAGASLLTRPNGTPFQPGDSVLITMRIVDVSRMQVELLPSGLRFSSSKPAELKLDYDFADDDFNRDGEVNDRDREVELRFAIWRQEAPGLPWVRQGSVKIEELREIEAKLTGFSRYAIAY